jgi:Domain of unknown function (DUF4258)
VDIEIIREKVRTGDYILKSHVALHALKEGFEREHIVEAMLEGAIIEEYADEKRALICGKTTLSRNVTIYLHVVCEYTNPKYIEIITAYIPDESLWENPPFKRRKRKK